MSQGNFLAVAVEFIAMTNDEHFQQIGNTFGEAIDLIAQRVKLSVGVQLLKAVTPFVPNALEGWPTDERRSSAEYRGSAGCADGFQSKRGLCGDLGRTVCVVKKGRQTTHLLLAVENVDAENGSLDRRQRPYAVLHTALQNRITSREIELDAFW